LLNEKGNLQSQIVSLEEQTRVKRPKLSKMVSRSRGTKSDHGTTSRASVGNQWGVVLVYLLLSHDIVHLFDILIWYILCCIWPLYWLDICIILSKFYNF